MLALRIDGDNKRRDRQISRDGNLSKCLLECILQPHARIVAADPDRTLSNARNGKSAFSLHRLAL
jgi:hypothetical protein